MPTINFAIEIITERTEFTNTSYGLVAGTFRFITGRPGYDGSTVVPTWEDTTPNTAVWYPGWLLKDRMTNPTRSIDISETGDYGTMSSFNFSLRNDLLLWVYVRDNAIYFTNRDVKVYCVIDDVFYQIWQGVISNNPYDEIDYQFICNDGFNKLHKLIPPQVIDTTSVPGSDQSVQGETIPVCVGDILYSKLQRITYEPLQLPLVEGRTASDLICLYPACAAMWYVTGFSTYPKLGLYTKGYSYAENQLVGEYIYVNKGGGNPDTDQLIKIRANDATTTDLTIVDLDAPFDFTNMDLFNTKYSYDPHKGENGVKYYAYNAASTYQATYDPYSKTCVVLWLDSPNPYIRFTGVDFYNQFANNGVGSNQIKFRVYFEKTGTIRFHLGTQLDPVLGTAVLIDQNGAPGWQEGVIDIPKQFGSNQTVTFSFDGKQGLRGLFADFQVSHSPSDVNTWWFSILHMPSSHITSNRDIKEYVTDQNGNIPVYILNDKTQLMDMAPNIILSKTTTGVGADLGHPEFKMYTSRMQRDGSVKYMTPVRARSWEIDIPNNGYMIIGGNNVRTLSSRTSDKLYGFDLCNRDQTNQVSAHFPEHTAANTYLTTIKLEFPKDYIDQDWEKIYACVDCHIQAAGGAVSGVRVMGYIHMLDVYGDEVDLLRSDDSDLDPTFYYPVDEVPVSRVWDYNSLPPDYYKDGGVTDGTTPNLWAIIGEDGDGADVPYKTLLELPDEVVNAIKDGSTTNMVAIKLYITSTGGSSENFSLRLDLKEAGFVCYKTINPLSDDFYVRLKGEMLTDGSETNTVYNAMRLMLEEYDKIPTTSIDYTNLAKMRHTGWNVGRQITDQKRSSDYITELAKHSFIGVYPTRTGKRGLRAWRDPYSELPYEYPIIVDSITQYSNTDVAQLYNDLYIEHNFNPATNKPMNVIRVTNVDQAAFPAATTMGLIVELWKEWVSGISGNTYADAKQLWDVCHESYMRANIVQPLSQSSSLSKLYWFSNITNDDLFKATLIPLTTSTEGSAYKYLKNCGEWLTRQKAIVKFSSLLDSDSVKTELLHSVNFIDPVYTHNETRTGWVTEVEIDINNNTLKLGYTLKPEDEVIDNLIIERGQLLNDDTHDESGDRDDQVQDSQNRT